MLLLVSCRAPAGVTVGPPEPEPLALIDDLGDMDIVVREEAVAALTRMGHRAVRGLERAAREHGDIEVRTRAEDLLKRIALPPPVRDVWLESHGASWHMQTIDATFEGRPAYLLRDTLDCASDRTTYEAYVRPTEWMDVMHARVRVEGRLPDGAGEGTMELEAVMSEDEVEVRLGSIEADGDASKVRASYPKRFERGRRLTWVYALYRLATRWNPDAAPPEDFRVLGFTYVWKVGSLRWTVDGIDPPGAAAALRIGPNAETATSWVVYVNRRRSPLLIKCGETWTLTTETKARAGIDR